MKNISDTARWAAVYRARETDRPDALFRDPFARRLAGERGQQIAREIQFSERHAWSWVTRTYLFDQFIAKEVLRGADMVINLAAGLDARPYRMPLPATLQWIEVDLPELLSYKEAILANEKPLCTLERVRLDLLNVSARRELFEHLGQRAKRVIIVSEGFLIYLSAEEARLLGRDLARPQTFRCWILDLISPGLLPIVQRRMGAHVSQTGAQFQFGPKEGPGFFAPQGWNSVEIRSIINTAARLNRLPLSLWFLTMWPESRTQQGLWPWLGVCLLAKQ